MTPWLSVLIPVYNVQDYLRECVQSVLAQADAGVEILMLDDCSTDGSAQLMQELAQGDARLRCLSHARNGGLSAARNSLLEQARGDYVWFLDSDDFIEPGAIARLRSIVEAQKPDLVMCDYRMLRERMGLKHRLRGEWHKRTFPGQAGVLLHDRSALLQGLFEAGHMHTWSKIARRALWGTDLRFPVGRYFEDMSTTPFLALRADSYWYEPQVWVAYRQRAGSILRTPNLDKAQHAASALTGLREAAAGQTLSRAAQFAWAHFAARSYIGAARLAARTAVAEPARQLSAFRACFQQVSPLSVPTLMREYLRRGWLWRAARLAYWLRRGAQAEAAP